MCTYKVFIEASVNVNLIKRHIVILINMPIWWCICEDEIQVSNINRVKRN